ncbi:peroxiredoxin family protein [Solirubrobacter soli]|uniref:peroxiredoxin family protein n=1 Tax=Solirubrobacter soli TaxID=363832 RepID=UPI000565B67C|nr:peroxiredoxin family protein [Solirubrobacter soli]
MTISNLLTPGDAFPPLTLVRPGGDTLGLPVPGEYTVVLFYRGSWCPYCNAQLRAFERAQDKLAEVGAHVVALSIDDEATTQATIDRHGLSFPVGHSADARALAQATGAVVNPDAGYVESTGFVVGPEGKVLVGVYSTNAIGRLVPDDVIGFIRYVREHEHAAA